MAVNLLEVMEARCLFAAYAPDVSFGRDGILPLNPDYIGNDPAVTLVHADSHGLLVTRTTGTIFAPTLRLERETLAGVPDPTFTPRDLSTNPYGLDFVFGDRQGRPLVLHSDYRVDAIRVTRYKTDGTLDTAFGDNGTATTAALSVVGKHETVDPFYDQRLIDGPDGSVYLSGYKTVTGTVDGVYGYHDDRYVFKLNAAGQVDTGFGKAGVLLVGSNSYFDSVSSSEPTERLFFATDPQNRLVVGQTLEFGTFAFTRYTTAGRVDTTYGTNGTFTYAPGGDFTGFQAALDAQGRALVLTSDSPAKLLRLTTGGRPDAAFGDGGVFRSGAYGKALVVQADGKIVVQVARARSYLVRLNGDGTPDSTFDGDGLANLIQTDNVAEPLYSNPTLSAALPGDHYLGIVRTRNGDTLEKLAPVVSARRGTGGKLYLTGDTGDDDVTVTNVDNRITHVVFNGQAYDFTKHLAGIVANLGGGNNRLDAPLNLPQSIATGDGDDTITTGDADDVLRTGSGSDTIVTNGGYDGINFDGGDKQVDAGAGSGYVTGGGARTESDDGGPLGRLGIVAATTDGATQGGWKIDVRGTRVSVNVGGGAALVQVEATETAVVDASAVRTRVSASLIAKRVTLTTRRAVTRASVVAKAASTVTSGLGDDTLRVSGGEAIVSSGAGRDLIVGGRGNDTIDGGADADRIYGGDGDDRLVGGAGNDALFGQGGDDTLIAGDPNVRVTSAVNRVDGGDGIDRYQPESEDDLLLAVESRLP